MQNEKSKCCNYLVHKTLYSWICRKCNEYCEIIPSKCTCQYEDKHGLTCPLYIPSKNPMEEDKAEEHTCYDIPCVACNNLNQEECPREKYRKGYCEIKGCPYQHQSNQENKNKECEQWNHDICTSPTCPLYPSKDIEDLENGRVLEKLNNQEDKSILKNIDYNVGTYEKIVEPIQENKDWEMELHSQLFMNVLEDENETACIAFIKKTKQESYEEGKEQGLLEGVARSK